MTVPVTSLTIEIMYILHTDIKSFSLLVWGYLHCRFIYIVDKSTRKSFSFYVYSNTTAQTLPPCLVLHPSYEPGVGESPWHNSLTHHHLENSLRLSPLSLYHWLSYQSDVVYLIPRVYYKFLLIPLVLVTDYQCRLNIPVQVQVGSWLYKSHYYENRQCRKYNPCHCPSR